MSWFRLYATLFIALAAAIVIVLEGAWRRQRLWSLATAALIIAVQIWTFQSPVGRQVGLAATDLDELQRQRDLFDRGASSNGAGEPGLPWQVFITSPTPAPTPSTSPGATPAGVATPSSASPTPSAQPTRPAPSSAAERVERYAELAAHEPLFILQFLALPIPFITRGTLVALATPEMLAWYGLFPISIFGLILLFRRRPVPAVVVGLVTLAMAVVYGTIVSNAGSLMRYRAQAIVLLAIPMAVGFLWVLRRARGHRTATGS